MSANEIPSIIHRGLPNAVIYDLTLSGQVRITLPAKSIWSSGLHWHEDHDEYLKVEQGSIRVRLGNKEHIITAAEGKQPELKVPKNAWHEWQRADPDGDEVIVIERTDPVDSQKAIFFWNLNGVILNAPKLDAKLNFLPAGLRTILVDAWVTLNLFVIFYHLDNFPVFTNMPRLLSYLQPGFGLRNSLQKVDWAVSHVILYLVAWVGWLLRVEPVQRQFTPSEAFASWATERDQKMKQT